jgi:hypothetical protein
MSNNDAELMREYHERADREGAFDVIQINLTLAGLQSAVMMLDNQRLVWEIRYCRPEEVEDTIQTLGNEQQAIIAANKDNDLSIVEAPHDRLIFVRDNLLSILGKGLASYRIE